MNEHQKTQMIEAAITPRHYKVLHVYVPGLFDVSDLHTRGCLLYNAYTRQLSCPHCNAKTPASPMRDDPFTVKEGAIIILKTAMLVHADHSEKGDDAHDHR